MLKLSASFKKVLGLEHENPLSHFIWPIHRPLQNFLQKHTLFHIMNIIVSALLKEYTYTLKRFHIDVNDHGVASGKK